jgi:ankyrin repeat protein
MELVNAIKNDNVKEFSEWHASHPEFDFSFFIKDPILYGGVEVFKYMLDQCDPDEINTPGLITTAAYLDKKDILNELLSRNANVNVADGFGLPAIHAATFMGYIDTVKVLIHSGANVNSKDNFGKTALQHAIKSGRVDIIQLLIEKGAF